MPCSGEYPESHVRQLNTPRGRGTEGPSRAQDRCIAISSSVDAPEYDPGREEKDFFLRRAFSRKAKDAPRQGQTVGKRTGSIEPGWIRAGIVAPIQHQFRKGSLMLEGASPLSDRSASSRKSEEVITDEPHAGKLARVVLAGFPEEGQFYIFLPNPSIIKYGWYHFDVFRFFRTRETLLVVILILRGERNQRIYRLVETLYVVVYLGRSIYIFPIALGLCLDLLCAKSKRLVPMEIPLGLIPRLMTKVESAWRKVKIGGVEKIPFWGIPKRHTFSRSEGIQCPTTDSSRNCVIGAEPGMAVSGHPPLFTVREALFKYIKKRCSQGPERLGHRNLDHLRAGKRKPPRPDQSKQQCRIRPPLALKEFTRGRQLSQNKGRSAAYCSRKTSNLYVVRVSF
ncbi:hypothetical protein Salat_2980300 [Sesamum alatum]|uniref:Uncharacterized protein n=1 Tax=Sesamum alatum TaxID=300844 RepID=A0AAE1XJ06_9LAMI|nr:hypothetical protein Salat_2980300 [Sesamum alatum]